MLTTQIERLREREREREREMEVAMIMSGQNVLCKVIDLCVQFYIA